MIEHVWSIVCSSSIIDQGTNNVSIFNIIEEVAVPEQAIVNDVIGISVELISLWIRSDLKLAVQGKSKVNLTAPGGELIKPVNAEVDLSKFERLRNRGLYNGIPFRGEGVYRFNIFLNLDDKEENWKQVASIPVKIMVVPKKGDKEVEPKAESND